MKTILKEMEFTSDDLIRKKDKYLLASVRTPRMRGAWSVNYVVKNLGSATRPCYLYSFKFALVQKNKKNNYVRFEIKIHNDTTKQEKYSEFVYDRKVYEKLYYVLKKRRMKCPKKYLEMLELSMGTEAL